MRPFCRTRRWRHYVKTCAVLLALFLVARYLTRHSLFYVHDTNHSASLHSSTTPGKTKDVFAAHFQASFRFQDNQNVNPHRPKEDSTPNDTLRLRNKKLRVPEDWPEFFRPRGERQFSMAYRYLHRGSRACQAPVKILVMILSLPQNHLQRQAIRQTWGSVVRTGEWPGSPAQALSKRLGIVFLLGEPRAPQPNVTKAVKDESAKYRDIVQWRGLHDTYFNLTMKVLLGLKWAVQECRWTSHVIKADDDTFLHVPRLLEVLRLKPGNNTIWGPYFKTSQCDRLGKYAVSREAYPFDYYTPHVKGNLYVLSGDLVPRLVSLAPYLPYNNMEDVHVTGTMVQTLGTRHTAFTRKEFSVVPRAPGLCLFQDNTAVLGSQMVSPDLHFRFWKTFSGALSCRGKKP